MHATRPLRPVAGYPSRLTIKPDTPRAAIVGAGLMGRWHARAAARAGARIVAVVDTDRSSAAALSARYPGSRIASDLANIGEMATVAHVCTNVDSHAATASALLGAGLHAFVEKPLAASAAETSALLEQAAAADRLICPAHQFPFQRGVREAVDALRSVGPLLHFDFVICTAGATGEENMASLVDTVLPHPLSLVSAFLPGSLARLKWQVLRPAAGELRAVSAFGSATVSILLSTAGRPTTNTVTLICERGTITADLFHGFSVVESGGVSRTRKIARPLLRSAATLSAAAQNLVWRAARRQPAFPGLNELTALFYEAVGNGGPAPISPSEVREIAVARELILKSAGS